jgi:hypothetical protein
MKLGKIILITAAITVLLVFLTGLIGLAISTFKFLFWVAVLVGLIVLALKLLGGRKTTTPTSGNALKELESWEKMFDEYKQSSDYKTK